MFKVLARWQGWRGRRRQQRFYRPFVRPGDLCFDVGANHGRYTQLFLKLGAHVVAVEPQPHCAAELVGRYARNPRVQVVQAAAGERPGQARLQLAKRDEVSTLSPQFMAAYGRAGRLSWPHAIEVDIVTLDQLIELYGAPAFIKLDVEGYEPQTLAGLHSAPRALSFEYNVRLREQAAGCIQQAAALGRCVFNFSAYEHGRWQWPQWLAAAGAQQALQALPNDLATGDFFVKYIVP